MPNQKIPAIQTTRQELQSVSSQSSAHSIDFPGGAHPWGIYFLIVFSFPASGHSSGIRGLGGGAGRGWRKKEDGEEGIDYREENSGGGRECSRRSAKEERARYLSLLADRDSHLSGATVPVVPPPAPCLAPAISSPHPCPATSRLSDKEFDLKIPTTRPFM
ncbi:hypothetical protein KM043_016862 [Ampulex compressa]|nr:hypothetical protein KM043_016862 [Ampulex compressa]